ncbi:hypothetical protein [Urechidicola croceus]|nr:hypothetical protein [Urechidicola croceus]
MNKQQIILPYTQSTIANFDCGISCKSKKKCCKKYKKKGKNCKKCPRLEFD